MDQYKEIIDIIQSAPAIAIIILYFYARAIKKQVHQLTKWAANKKIINKEIDELKVDFSKDIDELKNLVSVSITEMKAITERGIKSGEDSRKELRIDLNRLTVSMAEITILSKTFKDLVTELIKKRK